MPIPKTRSELTDLISESWTKLHRELEEGGPDLAQIQCVDDWSVKDVLAVRAWWAERVVDWIEAGQRGESPPLPAAGYTWSDTPRLNADIVERSKKEPYERVRARLKAAHERVLTASDSLDDTELLEPGVFDWAGKWPISRWLSINTARQYTTARTYVRRASKRLASPGG